MAEIRHHNTLAIAQAALGKIGALGECADPKSYALWYGYAAGDSGLLTAAVNTRLASKGSLTAKDIEELHRTYIGPDDVPDKVDRLGARIAGEIEQVAVAVGSAGSSAGAYSADLASATQRLGGIKNGEGVRTVVEHLLKGAREMAATNARLQLQLHAMWEEIAQLRRELTALRAECQTDPLTSLGNRRCFIVALERTMAECCTAKDPLTLLMVDIDGIRAINETYGHVVGDRVLRFVAATLKDGITGRDLAARYRDDRFAVVLPRAQLAPAVRTAEQFRHAIMKCELIKRSTGEKQARLTVSIGVATQHEAMSSQALIEAAEFCLYAAKRSGRNCVISEGDEKLFAAIAGTTLSSAAIPFVRR
ncbi:MAG: GGDEF domain-containing protein [Xanthobacteraceae bacterium]